MYFIEQIVKFFLNKPNKKNQYNPQNIDECEHLYMPIDSSGEYLACSKCGKLIKREDIKK